MDYVFKLDDPEARVEVDGETYKDGDTFSLPKGWRYDPEFSRFVKRPSFAYETKRRVRNAMTGAQEWETDTKRVSLPVVEVEEIIHTDLSAGGPIGEYFPSPDSETKAIIVSDTDEELREAVTVKRPGRPKKASAE